MSHLNGKIIDLSFPAGGASVTTAVPPVGILYLPSISGVFPASFLAISPAPKLENKHEE